MDIQMKEVKDDIKELRREQGEIKTVLTRIATAIENQKDIENRLRQIELERAKESTAREWLHKNWIALAVIIAIMASESAILAKLI